MNYLNKAILNKYKEHWHTLRDAGFIKNLNKEIVEEIESVYKSEVDANFFVNKWCMSCVAEMINALYQVTKFDAELDDSIQKSATQELVETIEIEEAIVEKPKKRKYNRKK